MSVVGHQAVVSALMSEFPSAAILFGPDSVGKWTAAEHVRREHKISEPDVLRVHRLGMVEAREVVYFAQKSPVMPWGRVAIIDLDHGDWDSWDTLLKAVEDAHPEMHFLMTASRPVPGTLWDRAHVYHFGLLKPSEVSQVLQEKKSMAAAQADRLAAVSSGQVRNALEFYVRADDKATVLLCIRALRERDPKILDSLADRWRDEHTQMLTRWAHEAVSRQWRQFNESETGEVGTLPLRVLMALRLNVRPRLVVRSLLMDVLMKGSAR